MVDVQNISENLKGGGCPTDKKKRHKALQKPSLFVWSYMKEEIHKQIAWKS